MIRNKIGSAYPYGSRKWEEERHKIVDVLLALGCTLGRPPQKLSGRFTVLADTADENDPTYLITFDDDDEVSIEPDLGITVDMHFILPILNAIQNVYRDGHATVRP